MPSLILHLLIHILSYLTAADGLGKVFLQIPALVTPGDSVTLRCLYHLDGEPLYAVNWYKGNQEFFRYVPNELPHSRVFPQPGITVDVNQSGPNTVVLKNVQPAMAGKYKCEVSADAPFFSTYVKADYLNVTLPPAGNVKLQLDKVHYFVGEYLRANCTSAPSKPPANITWFLNGKMVNSSKSVTYLTLDRIYYVTFAELVAPLDSSLPRAMHIMCQANVQSNFKSSAEQFVTISEDIDSYDGFFSSLPSSGLGIHVVGSSPSLMCIFLWMLLLSQVFPR